MINNSNAEDGVCLIMKWNESAAPRKGRGQSIGRLARSIGLLVLAITLFAGLPQTISAIGKGARGADVYVIQGMLVSVGSYGGPISGYYDNATVQGVKYFQKKHGLKATGIVDNRTLEALTYTYLSRKVPSAKNRGGAGQGKGGKGGGQGYGGGQGQGQGGGQGYGGGQGQGQGEGQGYGGGQGQGIGGGQEGEQGKGAGEGQAPKVEQAPSPSKTPSEAPKSEITPSPNQTKGDQSGKSNSKLKSESR